MYRVNGTSMHADPRGRGVADVILSAETSASDSATARSRCHRQRRGSARADTTGLLQRSARRGLPYSSLAPLQRVINAATRLVFSRGTTSRTPQSSCTGCRSAREHGVPSLPSASKLCALVIIFLPCGFYLSSFFPRLISAVGDWMSTILPHMVWP